MQWAGDNPVAAQEKGRGLGIVEASAIPVGRAKNREQTGVRVSSDVLFSVQDVCINE